MTSHQKSGEEELVRNSSCLSCREQEVLLMLSRGMTVKGIALSLSLSAATIDTYVRRIYGKLGVHSRAEAVAELFLSR